ncbi:O-antigen ligase [Massilia sp. TS11]|uniref:O-antigen ligase family protein n=1 Tax=Massilia sp. TS11 TaxID=2908003 RepID=UPI001EDA5D2E|nr:O-antigen ligase family protein [Massilia sp. TS11]MCG2583638.1 O-antigen ligase family protein [Massilia sp. TS11]
MNNNANPAAGPVQHWVALLLGCTPVLTLLLRKGASVASFLLLLTALALWPRVRAAWAALPRLARWSVLAFALQAGFMLLLVAVRGDPLSIAEKPVRMLAAASALLLVLAVRPDARAFWGGCIAAAMTGLLFIGWERVTFGLDRPGGQLNPITYGDLALCLALVAAAALGAGLGRRWNALALGGALAGLAASLITGSRGGLLGLLLAAVVALVFAAGVRKRVAGGLLLAGSLAVGLAYVTPETGMRERLHEVVEDVQAYREGQVYTHIGMRFELWQAGATLAADHPLRGYTEAQRQQAMAALVQAGQLDARALSLPHLHNDALQALVLGGVPGLLLWLASLLVPAAFFVQSLDGRLRPGAQRAALALAGLFVVSAYLGFGLTEVIFWSVNASLCYALLVFICMGLVIITDDGQ